LSPGPYDGCRSAARHRSRWSHGFVIEGLRQRMLGSKHACIVTDSLTFCRKICTLEYFNTQKCQNRFSQSAPGAEPNAHKKAGFKTISKHLRLTPRGPPTPRPAPGVEAAIGSLEKTPRALMVDSVIMEIWRTSAPLPCCTREARVQVVVRWAREGCLNDI
jgi:hypothetical protein